MQSYAFGLTPLYAYVLTYFLYIHPLLQINIYSDSSFRQSQFLGYCHFYLSLRLSFTKPILKRFPMVSVYCLRPVYTFPYTIINGNIIASFVLKKKSLIFCSLKIFCVRTQPWNRPSPLVRNHTHLSEPYPPPLCVRTTCMTLHELIFVLFHLFVK